MGVNALGDVISILKHAKIVQGKRTSDTVLSKSEESKPEKKVEKKVPEVSNRLGPPKPVKFETKEVTKRLGPPNPVKFDKKISAFSRLEPQDSKRVLKRPTIEDEPEVPMKKRYFKIVTLKDGTQQKEYIEKDEAEKFTEKEFQSMTLAQRLLARPYDDEIMKKRGYTVTKVPISSRLNSDRNEEVKSVKSRLNSDRDVQQKSIKSRLSAPTSSVKSRLSLNR